MKRSVIFALALMFVSAAFAQSRPDTRKMDCASVRKLVQTRGSAVLSTGDNTYDRFVWTENSCSRGEQLVPAYAPTKDFTGCQVGYTCRTPNAGAR